MGGPNLEVFKFGLYIMFPIGWMYYFGTNLENRFSVPDFWPKPEETYRIPFEKGEIQSELRRLEAQRLERRKRRLEGQRTAGEEEDGRLQGAVSPRETLAQRSDAPEVMKNAGERGSGREQQQERVRGKSWWGGLW